MPTRLNIPQASPGGVLQTTDIDTLAEINAIIADADIVTNVYYSTVAAGTAYSLTATPAALDFGTTDPAITIAVAGTYMINARVKVDYNGATFAASQDMTFTLRRTNNTAADLTNGESVLGTGVTTIETSTLGYIDLPTVYYTTANTNDAITIFGDVSVIPSAGSLDVSGAEISAVRLY